MQIVVLAQRGTNDQSFVAIDQLSFMRTDECSFQPKAAYPNRDLTEISTTAKPEHWLECTFQQNLCGWLLSEPIDDAMFAWTRTNGKSLEENELLGPIEDHNHDKNGKKRVPFPKYTVNIAFVL